MGLRECAVAAQNGHVLGILVGAPVTKVMALDLPLTLHLERVPS